MLKRRDVTIWFCKIVGIFGVFSVPLGLLSGGMSSFGGRMIYGDGFVSLLCSLGVYGFIWIFAGAIGGEMVHEADNSEVQSARDLVPLLWRCVGFIFLADAAISLAHITTFFAFDYFSGGRMSGFPGWYIFPILVGFVRVAIGFALAFGRRIFLTLRSPAPPQW